jgi:glutaredoxin
MILRSFFLVLMLGLSGFAHAQQYRWVDEKGRVQFTDTPPPAGAKDVRKEEALPPAGGSAEAVPFAVARALKDFPVTLYSSPPCKEVCGQIRSLLNRRGIPFAEVQVWDEASHAKLKAVAGNSDEVPVLTVGRSVQKGFNAEALNTLLDTAGYPRAGSVPARSQGAPPPPDGIAAAAKPAAKPVSSEPPPKAGPYDPSGLQGTPQKPGPYGVPGNLK